MNELVAAEGCRVDLLDPVAALCKIAVDLWRQPFLEVKDAARRHHRAGRLRRAGVIEARRITGLLTAAGHRVSVVALVADEETVLARHKGKRGDHAHDPECLRIAIECNNEIRGLAGVAIVDTTDMNTQEMAEAIVRTGTPPKPGEDAR